MKTRIDNILDGLKGIGTFSTIISKINTMLLDEDVSLRRVAEVIEKDSSITATVLRLANSSYYGLSKRVTTIPVAVTVLGLNTIRNLITTVSLCSLFRKARTDIFDPIDLWWHSLGSAVCAKTLLGKAPAETGETAFVCALIHDIGKAIIYQAKPREMERVIERAKEKKEESLVNIEKEILGFSHARIGSELAKRWRFPDTYVNIIRFHHNPNVLLKKESLISAISQENTGPSALTKGNIVADKLIGAVVYAANQMAKAFAFGKSTNEKAEIISEEIWDLIGIPLDELPSIVSAIYNDFYTMKTSWSPG